MMRFAITGVAGFVAPRHLDAIRHNGGRVSGALDPHDSVGILDKYDRDTAFFTEPERFERWLNKGTADWLSVCAPNHLHDVHARMGLRAGTNVLCEKPLALSPWNLDQLEKEELLTAKHVYTVLQLRLMPVIERLHRHVQSTTSRHTVTVQYAAPRGHWYMHSWKNDIERSGGIITNIGIHLLDLLLWLFGPADRNGIAVSERHEDSAAGTLTLRDADVTWRLSINGDKPQREIVVDGTPVKFDEGFTDLHRLVYARAIRGQGFSIADARPAVELAHRLRYFPIR